MKIQFCGAVREVTGSKHLLEIGGKKILLDCGFFQGRRKESFAKNSKFPFDAREIDAVILSHAHIDHCGSLPSLTKNGFAGKIFCTTATAELLPLMLFDSAHIQKMDAQFFARKLKNTKLPIDPLYDEIDVEKTLAKLRPQKMHEKFEISENISAEFFDAGHVLGSAILKIKFVENSQQKSLVFSGDLGRKNRNILRDPEIPKRADFLICESTYGARVHPPSSQNREKLAKIVNRIFEKKGKLIIPSFALERTQEIIFDLQILRAKKKIPKIPIVIDSPLAIKISKVFENCAEFFDDETRKYFYENEKSLFENIEFSQTADDSKKLNFREPPFIIISASGMCEAGRIRHHLFNCISNEKNTILFVGFQAANTLGRKLVEGAREIKIFDQILPVHAEIAKINGFSGHADADDLMNFATKIENLKNIFVVHGEENSAETFAENLKKNSKAEISVPRENEVFEV